MKVARDIPWRRIFAEGVAIVVSILLAFGIEAWWSNRQEQRDVREHLVALKEELVSNLAEIEQEKIFRRTLVDVIRKISASIGSPESLRAGELDSLLAQLIWVGYLDVGNGALGSVLQSDVFSAINDGELRRVLAALPVTLENAEKFESYSNIDLTDRYIRFLIANGSYSQVINSYEGGRPGLGGLEQNTKFPVVEMRDHSLLMASDEFVGLLAVMHGTHQDVDLYYGRLNSGYERAIELINRQVR